jgi:energy-coupling factor transporter ATP-binding protein EcfA2
MEPALLLADEPTGNLDSTSGGRVFDLLTSLCRTQALSVVMVTHNMELAGAMDRCLTLVDGRHTDQKPKTPHGLPLKPSFYALLNLLLKDTIKQKLLFWADNDRTEQDSGVTQKI